ncbi:hypothetical protein F8154_13360 [Alkaliphilus pronyensis]|uniref:Uncharacterized protein n=1 Tax=Alkaliphilus pronyensis TaxID=1482732 RepID=A0A6I0F8D0_9FIRM|nr:DUF4297 family anti-phage-associated protein [Alkaliphilus pronyensis]KAB3531057.1 hypothetical protein F8154_13360 [Alkaliphilus pronyensis]
MRDRTAINTIKGYFYQFDYSILTILELRENTETVTIEGIEDIDISELESDTAAQCKYYASTEYNHSEIASAIRFMLSDFKQRIDFGNELIHYKLYGYYQKGQEKLPTIVTIEFLKEHFLTYTHKKVKILYHEDLHITDDQLQEFLSHLQIDINAKEFEQQTQEIYLRLQEQYGCTPFEAEHYYYNNALKVIKGLATSKSIEDRRICRWDFINSIDKKELLFNQWFYFFKGEREVFKKLRREHFTNLNVLPIERFFLIEVDRTDYSRAELKEVILIISSKWSKLSQRTPNPFCPYIYINNLESDELIALKTDLYQEGVGFIDGVPFNGADFNPKSIAICANYHNQIKIKLIDKLDYINLILKEITKTKEIYQFYLDRPYYELNDPRIKHIMIQNLKLKNVKEII